tara:strand:- start:7932 stop:8546 length:615 start_codon:yes stop_codon:yes gene_type:complete
MTKFILMDVEGTTTSIRFVHDTLFPYAYSKIDSFVAAHPQIVSELDMPAETLKRWIKEDKKEPLLKKVQGLIWEAGYKSGELKGHLYDDVPLAFKRWIDQGMKLGIYSSGSVLAQKLLYKYSVFGDMDQWISANFDTGVGHKRDKSSYDNIVAELKLSPSEILFLSDIEEELDAAQAAGLKVKLLNRDEMRASKYETTRDFNSI